MVLSTLPLGCTGNDNKNVSKYSTVSKVCFRLYHPLNPLELSVGPELWSLLSQLHPFPINFTVGINNS